MKLTWETAYGKAYAIQLSSDASAWSTVYSTTTADGGVDDLTGLSGTGRYVRVYGTQRATSWGYSLWELEVYGSANLALRRPVAASSVEGGLATLAAAYAVDGDAGTRWSSDFADPQWIRVDLGTARQLNRVKLRWEAAYARAYTVQVSDDGATWRTVHGTSSGDGGTDAVTGLSGVGRYVRVYGTQRATPWGYSLWELEAYGT